MGREAIFSPVAKRSTHVLFSEVQKKKYIRSVSAVYYFYPRWPIFFLCSDCFVHKPPTNAWVGRQGSWWSLCKLREHRFLLKRMHATPLQCKMEEKSCFPPRISMGHIVPSVLCLFVCFCIFCLVFTHQWFFYLICLSSLPILKVKLWHAHLWRS